MSKDGFPDFDYRLFVDDSGRPSYVNRLLVGTATTGLVRVEWVAARYGAVIPHNWSMVTHTQPVMSYYPLRYQVDDAQNLIVKAAVERDFEWLLLLEHDVVIPAYLFLALNKYIREPIVPVVSGLYFTRTYPSDPLIYRGRGVGHYTDWELGEKVWCDGVPTGCLLVHMGILREMWKDSEEYQPLGYNTTTRRVFKSPVEYWFDAINRQANINSGTSDLDWCMRVIEGDYIRKAGWETFCEKANMKYPFLVDTTLFCTHINSDGSQFPNNWQEIKAYTDYIASEEFKKPSVTVPEWGEDAQSS